MGFKFIEQPLPGVILVVPDRYRDPRGFFSETYNRDGFREGGIEVEFMQDNHSLSVRQGVLRGLHFQTPPFDQAKLVRVVKGAVLDVAIDIRAGAPTYGRHVTVPLSAENWHQLFVPSGFAHGFLTLLPETEVEYKVSNRYAPDHEFGIAWNDPDLAIDWPLPAGDITLSDRDRALPFLRDLGTHFRYPTRPESP